MKILQVVTLASRTGAYGGPMSVAESQSLALTRLGHVVGLVAGIRLDDAPARVPEGSTYVPVRRVLPLPGFAGYWSFGVLTRLQREVRASAIVHVHFARDLVPITACVLALMHARPLYLQTHGMIQPSDSAVRRLFDWFFIRPILRRATMCLVYTSVERSRLEFIAGSMLVVEEVLNGAETPGARPRDLTLEDSPVRIMFAGRLHPRKRVSLLLTAIDLLPSHLKHRVFFTIIGPDEGELSIVQNWMARASVQTVYLGGIPISDLLAELSRTHLLVQPSVNEPFSVTLLDAQARGCPVIVSDTNGYARYCETATSGIVFRSDDAGDLARAIIDALSNSPRYIAMRLSAANVIKDRFSWGDVAQTLSALYEATARA